MNPTKSTSSCPFLTLSLFSAAMAAAAVLMPVQAAQATPAGPKIDKVELAAINAQYQRDRAVCLAGQSNQDMDACLYDAALAVETAKRRGYETGPVPYAENARQRCDALKGDDRSDCMARMNGAGTVSGSVAAGGLYRELVTITRGPVPLTPAAEPSAAPEPKK
jgi:fumarylacetoacetate (FAA) hydrolase family protein